MKPVYVINGFLESGKTEFICYTLGQPYFQIKGMVPGTEGGWVYFDYVPGESNVREGKADVTGKFCVIGSKLKEDNLAKLFEK